jgi:hypothetical protein
MQADKRAETALQAVLIGPARHFDHGEVIDQRSHGTDDRGAFRRGRGASLSRQ